MDEAALHEAVSAIPPGRWAVGVSGGGDSVALLLLLRDRADLSLTVVHLDHQTRRGASAADAQFVADLSARLGVDCVVERRERIEPSLGEEPANLSARYRAARMKLFGNVVGARHLSGVILAHQADDQAQTVLHRLIRSAPVSGLAGMTAQTVIDGLTIFRPLLRIGRGRLREFLQSRGQAWREDSSNQSDEYLRNRLRKVLDAQPGWAGPLLDLAEACALLRQWKRRSAPRLAERFSAAELAGLPRVLARESARQWLIAAGSAADQLSLAVLDRLVEMCRDAASAGRMEFPGGVRIVRRKGKVVVEGSGA